jgi:hypothetical protein
MIAFGIVWMFIASRLPNSKPIRIYDEEQKKLGVTVNKEEAAAERNRRRKLRKKLR